MKLNILKYLPLLAVIHALTGCEEYLDKTPDNRVVISTPEQMRQLMVDGYMQANYGPICEFASDNIVDNNSPDEKGVRYNLTAQSPADEEAFAWDDIVSSIQQDSPSMVWDACYHAIAVCNNVLQAAEKLEAEGRGHEIEAVKGEALLSRAFHHFILANVFSLQYAGDELSKAIPSIPYMDHPEEKVLVDYAREDLASVYNKIEADLQAGLPMIDDALYTVPKYHFNRRAAHAFAARFYLFKRDYVKADYHASQALGGEAANPAGMMRTWWSKTFTAADAMVRAYVSAEEQSNLMLIPTYSVWSRKRGERFAINRDAAKATVFGKGPTWDSYNFHPCYQGKLFLRGSQEYGVFSMVAGEIFEYTDKVAGIGFVHVIRPEFTTEEMVLTRAEARLYMAAAGISSQSGVKYTKDDALADARIWEESRHKIEVPATFKELTMKTINAFYVDKDPGYGIVKPLNIDKVCPSDKYQLTPDMLGLLNCILHFRRIELVETGMRWFDIKRYGIEITHTIGRNRVEHLTLNDPRRALQVPAEVISAGFAPNKRVLPTAGGEAVLANVSCFAK